MLKCLLHRQWRTLICLAVLLCFLMLTQDGGENPYLRIDYRDRAAYLEQYDPYGADSLFAGLHEDAQELSLLIDKIEQFEDYTGDIPEGERDPLEILLGEQSYLTYDMLIWREQMLEAPGQYTDTVKHDSMMLGSLTDSLHNQEHFAEIIENQREIMRRGIRRGLNVAIYEKTLDNLNQIESDFPIRDTLYAVKLLDYLENDWYILALLAVMMFSCFSTGNQQKVTNQVIVSRYGMRRFARTQILSALIIFGICMILYYLSVVLIHCEWDVSGIPWNHPVQILSTYENILKDLSIFEYIMTYIGLKILFCLAFSGIVLLISSLSPNNVFSFGGTVVLLGIVFLLRKTQEYGAWAIGNGRDLFEELCFVDLDYVLVPYAVLAGIILLLVTVVSWILIILHCDASARKWVK